MLSIGSLRISWAIRRQWNTKTASGIFLNVTQQWVSARHSHLDLFADKLGALFDDHGERFHRGINAVEKRRMKASGTRAGLIFMMPTRYPIEILTNSVTF